MTSHELPISVSDEITTYFEPHFERNTTDFVCVYGSSLYKDATSKSDIDLFIAAGTATSIDQLSLRGIASFIREMHVRLGRKIDEEVPYENKIKYSPEEVVSAINYSGFDITEKGITVPNIVKESTFLNSPEIKARLALNALTTPHAVFGSRPGLNRYGATRELAEVSVTLLAANLVADDEFSHESLFNALTTGLDGQCGEMYLGYKTEYADVEDHLRSVIGEGVERLSDRKVLQCAGDSIFVDRKSFNPAQVMHDACGILMQKSK